MRDLFGARRVVEMVAPGLCFFACHGITDSFLSERGTVVMVIDKLLSVTPIGIRGITVGIIGIICAILF
jgi:hypothetical protein